jgi:hypothetical protein
MRSKKQKIKVLKAFFSSLIDTLKPENIIKTGFEYIFELECINQAGKLTLLTAKHFLDSWDFPD